MVGDIAALVIKAIEAERIDYMLGVVNRRKQR
ncbi:MAG: hypothetical protein ACI8T1_005408 [Verrucomicrobiales bacterium]|jgi:hypothetical protein